MLEEPESFHLFVSVHAEDRPEPVLSAAAAASFSGRLPSVSGTLQTEDSRSVVFAGFEDEDRAVISARAAPIGGGRETPAELRVALSLVDEHILQVDGNWDLRWVATVFSLNLDLGDQCIHLLPCCFSGRCNKAGKTPWVRASARSPSCLRRMSP